MREQNRYRTPVQKTGRWREALRSWHPESQTKMARLKTNCLTCNTWKWMKAQQNYLTISLQRTGENWWQRSPNNLSSRACFPRMCYATPKNMYSWSGFASSPKCEVTTRLTFGKRLDWEPGWRAQKKEGWLQGLTQARFLFRKEKNSQRKGPKKLIPINPVWRRHGYLLNARKADLCERNQLTSRKNKRKITALRPFEMKKRTEKTKTARTKSCHSSQRYKYTQERLAEHIEFQSMHIWKYRLLFESDDALCF